MINKVGKLEFLCRYGNINERRHQLHEVIRLSGMNLVVNDLDMPLIIKVASIPKKGFRFTLLTMMNILKGKQHLQMKRELCTQTMMNVLFSLQKELLRP
jgi:hypothetical protein